MDPGARSVEMDGEPGRHPELHMPFETTPSGLADEILRIGQSCTQSTGETPGQHVVVHNQAPVGFVLECTGYHAVPAS